LEINPKARTVKIKNDGNISTLTLTNKPTIAPGGPPGGPQNMAGGPPRPPGFNRQPGANPGGFAPGTAPIPTRPVRSTPDYSQVSPQGNYAQPLYGGGYQGGYAQGATPGLSLPGAFNQAPSQLNNAVQPTAPPEVTAAMLALQKAAADNAGRPYPPAPPTFEGVPGLSSGMVEPPPPPPTVNPNPPPSAGAFSTGTLSHPPPLPK
jgi:hypothetical protein